MLRVIFDPCPQNNTVTIGLTSNAVGKSQIYIHLYNDKRTDTVVAKFEETSLQFPQSGYTCGSRYLNQTAPN